MKIVRIQAGIQCSRYFVDIYYFVGLFMDMKKCTLRDNRLCLPRNDCEHFLGISRCLIFAYPEINVRILVRFSFTQNS